MEQQQHARLASSLQWLSQTAQLQLAESTGAVSQLQGELASAASRLSGEAEARSAAWEKRLASARADWASALEQLKAECVAQLLQADELLRLQREEASVLREENELRQAQRATVAKRLAESEAQQRQMLIRARAAVRRAEAAEAEAVEATTACDRECAEHESARQRAEAERDVLATALAIGEGTAEYLEIALDESVPGVGREAEMLRAKLRSMAALVQRHAADAASASHAIADADMLRARAERRCAALERRLQACEGELALRRIEHVQSASRGHVLGRPHPPPSALLPPPPHASVPLRPASADGGGGAAESADGRRGELRLSRATVRAESLLAPSEEKSSPPSPPALPQSAVAPLGAGSAGGAGGGAGGVGGSAGDWGLLVGGASDAAHRSLVERSALVESMADARAAECDALAAQLLEARSELNAAKEVCSATHHGIEPRPTTATTAPARAMPERCQSDARAMPERCQSDARAVPERCQSDARAMPESCVV